MYNPLSARVYRCGAPFTRFNVFRRYFNFLCYLSIYVIYSSYLLTINSIYTFIYLYIYHCVISLSYKARVGRCALVFHTFSHFHSNSLNDHFYPLFPLIYIFVNTWMFSGMSLIFGEVWRVEDVLASANQPFLSSIPVPSGFSL